MKKHTSPWLALIVVLAAPLLSVIDVFIVNVAIPAIKTGVSATDGQVQLVIAGYLLGYASFLITGGRAGDHFGRKKVFFLGMLAFTFFSLLCGLSQTPFQLNITRFFQGVSASFMVPQSIAFIQVIFTDPRDRAKAIGWFGITLGVASILGQVLGGYFSELHTLVEGWRLIFLVNLPVGAVALWATKRFLSETQRHEGNVFDYSGIAILTAALFCLIIPLIQGREQGWPAWSILLLIASAAVFAYFVYDQRKKKKLGVNPLIDVDLFDNKGFNLGLLAVLFQFMMHTSYLLTSAVYLQNGLGISAFDCGLYFILPGILFTVSSIAASRLLPRYGKIIPQIGVVIISFSFVLQIFLFKPGVGGLVIFLLMGVYGLGNGLVLPSLLNIALRTVPEKFAGAAAGVYSTFQQTASALGVSIIGGLFFYFIERGKTVGGYEKAFHYTTMADIVCLVLCGFLLYLLPSSRTQATSPTIAE